MNEFPYDVAYDPALPVCQVVLSTESTGRRVKLTAVIDTGADGTIVPVRHLEQISARRVFETGLRSQWGERRTVFLYLVNLQIGTLELTGIHIVGDELGEEFILGRNVLNELRLLLDGPTGLTQLLDDVG
jgi:predicted aspartyl protease